MENEQTIEKFRDYHDSLTDKEYSILMYLLKNNNQKPYIEYGTHVSYDDLYNNFLNDTNKFSKSKYHGNDKEIWIDTPHGKEKYYRTGNGTQYLLKDEYYQLLKYLIEKKGSIGHFKRNIIDLEQD